MDDPHFFLGAQVFTRCLGEEIGACKNSFEKNRIGNKSWKIASLREGRMSIFLRTFESSVTLPSLFDTGALPWDRWLHTGTQVLLASCYRPGGLRRRGLGTQQRLGHPGEWLERSMYEPQNASDVGRDSLQRRHDFSGRQLTWAAPAWLSSFFILLHTE